MTPTRRVRQTSRWTTAVRALRAFATLPTLLFLALAVAAPQPLGASTSAKVVVDRHTGLAIAGFDPVAYFLHGEPIQGVAEHEERYGGAIWRFVNAGNRAAFAGHPAVYAPAFGGYDPTGVARGVARPGNPEIFAIVDGALYLFFSEGARDAFRADTATLLAAAVERWPDLQGTLVR